MVAQRRSDMLSAIMLMLIDKPAHLAIRPLPHATRARGCRRGRMFFLLRMNSAPADSRSCTRTCAVQ